MRDIEDTYYGSNEREALKDMMSPSRIKTNCVMKVLAGRHVLVIGGSGSGKTFWMTKVCDFLPTYIFINPQIEQVVDKITQVVTENENEVIELLENGYRRIQFIPSEDDMQGIEQLKTIRLDLWEVAKNMNIKDGQFWMNFISDESQIYAWKGSRNDLDNFARRGRRYGIKSWFLTQRPQNLSSGIINNVTHQVIFKSGAYESMYFKNYKIPIEQEKEWIDKPYHYVVYDGSVMQRCTPI